MLHLDDERYFPNTHSTSKSGRSVPAYSERMALMASTDTVQSAFPACVPSRLSCPSPMHCRSPGLYGQFEKILFSIQFMFLSQSLPSSIARNVLEYFSTHTTAGLNPDVVGVEVSDDVWDVVIVLVALDVAVVVGVDTWQLGKPPTV